MGYCDSVDRVVPQVVFSGGEEDSLIMRAELLDSAKHRCRVCGDWRIISLGHNCKEVYWNKKRL